MMTERRDGYVDVRIRTLKDYDGCEPGPIAIAICIVHPEEYLSTMYHGYAREIKCLVHVRQLNITLMSA